MKIIDIIPGVKVYKEDNFSILFGCPPEIIKHFMSRNIVLPDYVLLPDTLHYRGVLQNATEFVLYYHLFGMQNFIKGKKLNILGERAHVENNLELLRLTLLGPTREEYQALDPHGEHPFYEELYRESRALALKDKSGKEVPIDGFVNFCFFKDGVLETEHFNLTHEAQNIYEINGTAIDVNFAQEQLPPYDLRPDFVPRMPSKFGLDVLGGASGFSPMAPSSSLLLNYNSHYMLIDCPPYLEHSLLCRGISTKQLKSIFLSHIHDDHCNLFPLVLFHERIKFLCTREVFWMACKKLSLMTMHDTEEFYSYFDFVELEPYKINEFYGLHITPHYSVHSIPTIGATFTMNCDGLKRDIVFVGDNKALPQIKKMVEEGDVKEEKYNKIYDLYHDKYDLLVADGGMGILHGDPRDSLESKSNRVVFLHLEKLPDAFNTTFTRATHGKRFTIKEGTDDCYLIRTMHILNRYYPGISEEWQNTLLNNMNLVKYNAGDVIMKQGEISNGKTYVILSGNVRILIHDGKELRQAASNHAGDLIGEMAIIDNTGERSASIVARTPVTLGEIDGDILYSFMVAEKRIDRIKGMLSTRKILEQKFCNFGLSVFVNQQIAWKAKRIAVGKDTEVVKQGEPGRDFYFVLDGKFSALKDGREIGQLAEKDMFGEFENFGGEFRDITVKALSPGEVLRIDKDDIERIVKSTPSLYFFINQLIKDRGGKLTLSKL